MEFLPVATPHTESELAVMVGLLDAHGIFYFVQNRGFGGLYPGMQIPLYNALRIMVPLNQSDEAIELLSVFSPSLNEAEYQKELGFLDRLRVLIELLLSGWAVPVKRNSPEK